MSRHFILIEPDPIVCIDLKGTLEDEYPACHVETGEDLQKAKELIEIGNSDTTIIVKGSLIERFSDLADAIERAATRGCRIVTIGKDVKISASTHFLDVPFTTEEVIEATSIASADTRR